MSNVLEDFKIVKFKTINAGYDYGYKVWDEIEQELIGAQKNKKKLEIIFCKAVTIGILRRSKTCKEYNDRLLGIDPNLPTEIYFLTEEEFDILKK